MQPRAVMVLQKMSAPVDRHEKLRHSLSPAPAQCGLGVELPVWLEYLNPAPPKQDAGLLLLVKKSQTNKQSCSCFCWAFFRIREKFLDIVGDMLLSLLIFLALHDQVKV